MHNPEVYRQYVIKWHENIKRIIINGKKPELWKYLQAYLIDAEKCKNRYIRKWNMATQEIHRKASSKIVQDIRLYFQWIIS